MVVSKIRVSDYISQALSSIGVKYVYGIMGGGASGLNDGFIKNKSIQSVKFDELVVIKLRSVYYVVKVIK
jgi:TPP-dependent 2-oxoacid decarboxylase